MAEPGANGFAITISRNPPTAYFGDCSLLVKMVIAAVCRLPDDDRVKLILAQETAKATEDISRRVAAIQQDTDAAIGAIDRIIGQVNEHSTTIAAAVEQQTAPTNEMGRNIGESATGSSQIAQSVSGVASSAQVAADGVAEAQRTAENLQVMSRELQDIVNQCQVAR
jgi:methyl-accepting chemotaxis protein